MLNRASSKGWQQSLVVAALLASVPVAAQDLRDFPYVDSLSTTLAGQERWQALDSVGQAALTLGTDYPALRNLLGDAALRRGRPAAAIRHYGRALQANPADEQTRTQLALAYAQFNQPAAARLVLQPLPDSLRLALHLPARRALTQAWLEVGGKGPGRERRAGAGYGRIGVSSQLSTRLSLTQTVSYYNQLVQLPEEGGSQAYAIRQGEYLALLNLQVSLPWQLKGAYHLQHNQFGSQATVFNHLGYAALSYSRPTWTVQGGLYVGRITDTLRTQTDLLLTFYPLENLKLYGFGRGSLIRSSGHTYPNALLGLGGQLSSRIWWEGFWSPGYVPVLFERDGLDVYNLLDPLRYRLGANAYWQVGAHWRLHLFYVAGRYEETILRTPYTQHSLTSGLTWTW